jgi:hypothetical protein
MIKVIAAIFVLGYLISIVPFYFLLSSLELSAWVLYPTWVTLMVAPLICLIFCSVKYFYPYRDKLEERIKSE